MSSGPISTRRSARRIAGVEILNLNGEIAWENENDRAGYRHRVAAVGRQLGAKLLGGSVYDVPPGEKTWPYHYELGCEEWMIVLSGRPTLRTPDGEHELEPGDLAVFPEGPEGAHQLINRTDELCRVLLLSSKSPLAVVHYPDSGKVGVFTPARGYETMLKNGPNLDYWDGED
jgi:uncharacterized cupin superfamily protein